MLLKVEMSKAIRNFLETDLIYNLNILGVIDNVPTIELYVDNEEDPKGVLVRKDYFHYIYTEDDSFLDETLETFFKDGFYGFSGVKRSIAEKIRSRFNVSWESPCSLYYLPKENLELNLIKNPVSSINIEDAETVDKYYTYRHPGSLEIIKNDIRKRPSSAVYVDRELVCWVLIHDDDSMGIMYTKEGHRKKGYAVDVSIDLAEKVINRGKIPFLQIVEGNNLSPGLATKCGFIPHGNSDWFGIISGCPKELKEVFNVSEDIFLKGLSDELKESFRSNLEMKNHLYYALYNLKKNNFKIEDFRIEEVEGLKHIEKWCDIVANTHSVNRQCEEVKRELFNTVNKEDTPFKLYIGYHRDEEVSALCTLKIDEDVCGIYLNSILPGVKREERVNIKKATILETLKLEIEKNRLELAIAQTSKDEVQLFEELGFQLVTNN